MMAIRFHKDARTLEVVDIHLQLWSCNTISMLYRCSGIKNLIDINNNLKS